MAVKRFISNTDPMTDTGALTKKTVGLVPRREDDPILGNVRETFNINDYDCCYEELAFADPNDPQSGYKNDKTALLFYLSLPTDTVTIKLFKDCQEIATLNNNTYGTFFGFSYWGDHTRVGFLVDWLLVYNAFGSGLYHMEADRIIINQNSQVKTHTYRLDLFDEYKADGTVKMRTITKGYIEGGVNYTGNNVQWVQEIRMNGYFGNSKPILETDNYQTTNRTVTQIKDQIVTDYTLTLEPIQINIFKPLIYDKLLANEILISDYNLFNPEKFDSKAVVPTELIDAPEYFSTAYKSFTIQFRDRIQNIIKRNVQP